jgi:hypothetical protein
MNRLTAYDADDYAYVKGGKVTNKKVAEAILRLAAYEDTGLSPDEIPHWIPVSERPPEESEYRNDDTRELIPLLVCVDGTEYPFRAVYDGKHWGDGWSETDVKYWMPLPLPPKEEKGWISRERLDG